MSGRGWGGEIGTRPISIGVCRRMWRGTSGIGASRISYLCNVCIIFPNTIGVSLQCVPNTNRHLLHCVPNTNKHLLHCVPNTNRHLLHCVPNTIRHLLHCVLNIIRHLLKDSEFLCQLAT